MTPDDGLHADLNGWTREDFIDNGDAPVTEIDPWAVQLSFEDLAPVNQPGPAKFNSPARDAARDAAADFRDMESLDGLSSLDEGDDIAADNAGIDDVDDFNDVDVNDFWPDEPEPLAEYDGGLGEPLYDSDDAAPDFAKRLAVDEFVAGIMPATGSERREISSLLETFSAAQRRSWLPWLRRQEWDGRSLLLFLRFRVYWEANPDWWEGSYWSYYLGIRLPTWSRYSLSRYDQLTLIQHRIDRSPEDVIDSEWFEEWDEFALWRHGFPSFAEYALFRAALSDNENWMSYIDWDNPADAAYKDAREYCVRPNQDEDNDCRYSRPVRGPWFALQDWYDRAEWHDNLGW